MAAAGANRPSLRPAAGLLVVVGILLILGQFFSLLPNQNPLVLAVQYILGGSFLLLPFIYRSFRNDQQQRLNHWVRRLPPDVPTILYLRPFVTSGRLLVRCSVRSVTERFLYGPRWDLEMALSHAAGTRWQLVAIGDARRAFGAAKLTTSDAQWKDVLEQLATRAELIVIVPLPRPSTLWELEHILGRPEYARKTLVVMPPTFWGPTLRGRLLGRPSPAALWKQSRQQVGALGITLPPYRRKGALLMRSDQGFVEIDAWKFQPDYLGKLYAAIAGGAADSGARSDPAARLLEAARHPGVRRKRFLLINRGYTAAIYGLLLALLFRALVLQPFSIPTASMQPTLMIGDYFVTSKLDWGLGPYSFAVPLPLDSRLPGFGAPQRGDVAVFHNAPTGEDYIKRVIGLPGDRVQMTGGRLYLNGVLVPRQPIGSGEDTDSAGTTVQVQRYRETLPGGRSYEIQEISDDGILDNTRLYIVPAGCYFMLGDNRDRSADSRVLSQVGYVPIQDLIGRARWRYFSMKDNAPPADFWLWPTHLRLGRMFTPVE